MSTFGYLSELIRVWHRSRQYSKSNSPLEGFLSFPLFHGFQQLQTPCCSECGTFDGFPFLCSGCFKYFCVLGKHCDNHRCTGSLCIPLYFLKYTFSNHAILRLVVDTTSMKRAYCSVCKCFCSITSPCEDIPIVGMTIFFDQISTLIYLFIYLQTRYTVFNTCLCTKRHFIFF